MNAFFKIGRLYSTARGGQFTGLLKLVCAILLFGAGPTYGTPNNFGPYVITRTLPTTSYVYLGLEGLAFMGGSLYVLDFQGIHQVDPGTGQDLRDWSVPGLVWGQKDPSGLVWDGNTFWMSTENSINSISSLTLGSGPSATIGVTYQLSSQPMDLAYANGSLFYPEYLGSIRQFNPGTGQITGSLPSPSDYIYGLTFDGENLLAGFGPGGSPPGALWQLSAQTGAILNTWQTGASDIQALAYDQSSQTLFIGTGTHGIIVAQAPEPGTVAIGALGMMALLLSRAAAKRRAT